MAAVVATLLDMGWDPKQLLQWTDDFGNEWAIDPGQAGVVPRIAAMIRDRSIRMLWKKAGSHFCGEGIGDSEADLTAHRKIRKEYLKDGDFKQAGLLDMVAQGAAWPPARRAEAGQPVSDRCEFCKNAEGTAVHQAWQCPVILNGIGEGTREKTRHLESHVLKGIMHEAEAKKSWARAVPPPQDLAFWCRGIVPKAGTGALAQLLYVPTRPHRRQGDIAADEFLVIRAEHGGNITIGSDGSGGRFGSDVRLRRVGWSWAAFDCGMQVIGTIRGQVDGEQTVPRSELFALVHLVTHVRIPDGVLVEMHIDNAYVVNQVHALVAGWRPGIKTVHGDLWSEICGCPEAMSYLVMGIIRIYKVKAHLTKAEAVRAGYTEAAWEANNAADELADQAANESEYGPGDVRIVQELGELSEEVCRRLVAVSSYIVENREPAERMVRAKMKPIRQRLEETASTNGHDIVFKAAGSSGGVRCRVCGLQDRFRTAWSWVCNPCPGPGRVQGHSIRNIRGLEFCQDCGRYGNGLRSECQRTATAHGCRILNRLARKPPQPPYRVRVWPDGSQIEVEKPGPKQRGRTSGPAPRRRPEDAGRRPDAGESGRYHPGACLPVGPERLGRRLAMAAPRVEEKDERRPAVVTASSSFVKRSRAEIHFHQSFVGREGAGGYPGPDACRLTSESSRNPRESRRSRTQAGGQYWGGTLRREGGRSGPEACLPTFEPHQTPQSALLRKLRAGDQARQSRVNADISTNAAVPHAIVAVEPTGDTRWKAPTGSPSPRSGLEAGPRRPEKRSRFERGDSADPFVQEVGPSPAAIKMQQLRARVQAKEAAVRAGAGSGQAVGKPGRDRPGACHPTGPEGGVGRSPAVASSARDVAVPRSLVQCVASPSAISTNAAVPHAIVAVEPTGDTRWKAPTGSPSPRSGLEAGPRRPEKRSRFERGDSADPFVQEVGPSPAAIKMQQLRARVQAKEAAVRAGAGSGQAVGKPGRDRPGACHPTGPEGGVGRSPAVASSARDVAVPRSPVQCGANLSAKSNAPAGAPSPRSGPEVGPGRPEKGRRVEEGGTADPFVQGSGPSPGAVGMQFVSGSGTQPSGVVVEPAESARFNAPAGASSPGPGPEAGPRRPGKRRRVENSGTDDPFVQEVGPSPEFEAEGRQDVGAALPSLP